jgi:hypothetical protein
LCSLLRASPGLVKLVLFSGDYLRSLSRKSRLDGLKYDLVGMATRHLLGRKLVRDVRRRSSSLIGLFVGVGSLVASESL